MDTTPGLDEPARPDQTLLSAAIGHRSQVHYTKFFVQSHDHEWTPSWHWPAFFVTSLWLLYRKLWVEWLLYVIVLPIAAMAAAAAVGFSLGFEPEHIAALQVWIILGMSFLLVPVYANAIYARKLRRLLRKARAANEDPPAQQQWLARHGGTSPVWLFMLVLAVLILALVAAVTLPAYQNYIRNAEAARVELSQADAVQVPGAGARPAPGETASQGAPAAAPSVPRASAFAT